ncbi:MAG: hypothetical protein KY466_15890 [Gemmatimonadetes bacterium]|nr:hypothetical protein [Gemmatimonadota bacterium]
MRRTLILLALFLAGIGGTRSAHSAAPAAGVHEIASLDGATSAAFLRSAGLTPSVAWQEGSGPAPRPLHRRPGLLPAPNELVGDFRARAAAFRARSTTHRRYAAPLALSRAGRASFNTTTPPPFRVVV